MAVTFAALLVAQAVTSSALFEAVMHWCWHELLPLVDAHPLGAVALVLPGLALLVSLGRTTVALANSARSVSSSLARASLGPGPAGSLVVDDPGFLLAAAGLRRPRVVVSPAALRALDAEELAAGLAHERGPIVRRHRWVLVFAELLRATAKPLWGTSVAHSELGFHLERDADRFAVERGHDPAALAGAICKAAGMRIPAPACALGGSLVTRRVRLLLEEEVPGRAPRRAPGLLAVAMAAIIVSGSVALPAAAHAGLHAVTSASAAGPSCPSDADAPRR
jgi:plasmid stabilization system protein ParE